MSKWIITPDKFLHEDEVKALRNTIEAAMLLAKARGRQIAYRDYVVIEVCLSTGLRVSELSNLLVSDLQLKRGQNSLVVSSGKGKKTRIVTFSSRLKSIIQEYLEYRDVDSPYLFYSERRQQITASGLQKIFKKWAKRTGLSPKFSIHSLRHTYATMIYKASGYNLRLVQVQLGHESVVTTSVYSAVVNPDIEKAVEAMDRSDE